MSAPTEEEPPLHPHRKRWARRLLPCLWLAAAAWLYFGTAYEREVGWLSSLPSGYYGLQTAGFEQGHLHVALDPPPGLLALTDPYDPVANAPFRAHDMTFWQGKYYLYFGAAPVLLLFLPFHLLTGWYPTEGFAVALFCTVSFAGAAILLHSLRRYFPSAPRWVMVLALACLLAATPLLLLNRGAQFYQVPIACAAALQMLMFGAILRALRSERKRLCWLALAGTLCGLSFATRPNYVVSSIGLVAAVLWLTFSVTLNRQRSFRRFFSFSLAAFLPPLAIGIAVLAYNWARFGSATEFGMRYQLAGERMQEIQMVSLRYLWGHLWEYTLNPGTWSSYFPFLSATPGLTLGAARYSPWLWLAPFALVPLLTRGRNRPETEQLAITSIIAGTALANLSLLSSFFGMTSRYVCDFVPAWLLLGSIGALTLGARSANLPPRLARIVPLLLVFAGTATLASNLALYSQGRRPKGLWPSVERLANWPSQLYAQWTGTEPGPISLRVTFPSGKEGITEPLLSTGIALTNADVVRVTYLPNSQIVLSYFHAGLGGPSSEPITVDFGREHEVEIFLGSFCPPAMHPFFDGWDPRTVQNAKNWIEVKLNGRPVLRQSAAPYECRAFDIYPGRDPGIADGTSRFSGRILSITRRPLPEQEFRPDPTAFTPGQAVELKLWFPAGRVGTSEPLLATGSGNKSDLIYASFPSPSTLVLGFDHFGAGGPTTEAIPLDFLREHTLTLWTGPCATDEMPAAEGRVPNQKRLVLFLDGRRVLDTEQVFYPASIGQAVVGLNPFGASTASRMFSGRIISAISIPAEELLKSAPRQGQYGAVRMLANFPTNMAGLAEPLVVSGITGRGDFLYVRYLDNRRLRFGYDHWSVGGFEGEPVTVDYSVPHRIELMMGSLLPPGSAGDRNRIEVKLDGEVVFSGQMGSHPTEPEQITIGRNGIGGSTTRAEFSGTLHSIERLP